MAINVTTVHPLQADLVLYNATIHSMSPGGDSSAIAIAQGKVLYCGDADTARGMLAPGGCSFDLGGSTVLPGLLETHMHPPGNLIENIYSISLFTATSQEDVLRRVRDFISAHPEMPAYFGAGLNTSLFGLPGPRKDLLDAVCDTKPIYIRSIDGHNRWMNSVAFATLGIHRDTVPGSGILHRTADGELWGMCTDLRSPSIPRQEFSEEQRLTAMRTFQRKMHAWGYTGLLALGGLEQLLELHRSGELALRVNTSQTVGRDGSSFDEQLREMVAFRESLPLEFKMTTAKFFADGVVEGGTAFMNEPYEPGSLPGMPADYRGECYWELEPYAEAIALANRLGFDIHVHSIGDAATHLTLDAIERAQRQNGPLGQRNSITHLHHVAVGDIPRFAELGVTAAVQPFWHLKEPHWWEAFELRLLGRRRAEAIYPLGSLWRAGALLCSSSDFSGTPEPNPFWAIKAGVTRNLYNGAIFGVPELTDIDDPRYLLNPSERVPVLEMLKSYTINSAWMLRREQELGQLAPGYAADFIVVDRDPLAVDPLELDQVRVMQTWVGGKCVYEREMYEKKEIFSKETMVDGLAKTGFHI